MYPEDQWQKVEEQLSQINTSTSKGRMVMRNFLRSAQDIELDKQNRLALPSRLMEWSGIEDRAIFLGSGFRIELWSPEKLEEVDEEISNEEYQEEFEKVMSNVHL